MKKIKYLMFSILTVIGAFLSITKVNAEEYKGSIKSAGYISGPYYYMHVEGSHKLWDRVQELVRTSDGDRVYCIQPFAHISEDATYEVTSEDVDRVLDMELEDWKLISKIAYYGWQYRDATHDHRDDKWYVATQMLLWQIVTPDIDSYFTKTLKGDRDDTILKKEMDEIMALVNEHYVKPSFSNVPESIIINQSVNITDSKNVLKNYEIANVNGGTVSINGDKLVVKGTSVGNISFTIQKLGNRYSEPAKVYYAIDHQNALHKGNIDPININMSLKVIGGKVAINKVDSKTSNNVAQGEATLEGAVYGVYKTDGTKLTEITTDRNGFAKSDYLSLVGKVYIQEIKPSKGYKLDTNKYYVDITNDNLEPSTNVPEDVIEGRIKIIKHDSETNSCKAQGDAKLVGAKYGVYNPSGTLVDTLVIGDDCSATSKLLPYSRYTVKEIEAGEGYYIDTNTYSVNINEEKTLEITSKENVIKGKIKVIKYDSETNTCKAQGQATLVGAKYGVYDASNKLLDTLIIGEDCTAISKELPYYSKYKVKEIEPSKGYIVDSNVYTVNINSSATIDVTSKEDVIKNFISILKQYDFVDETTQFVNAEANIEFEIYYPDGRLFDKIVTNKNGYATIEIPYGVWRFHQVNTNTGFEKIYDFNITVDEESEKEQYYNILNNSLNAYLQVIKKDSETGKTIALSDTTFKIYNIDKKQYVSQYVGGKVISEFKTDQDGKFVTFLKLESGNYKLIEVTSPKGYLLNEEGCEFTIGENSHFTYTTYGTFITVYFNDNPIKGKIEIVKYGEDPNVSNGEIIYNQIPLEKVEFEIYADEDIKSSDGNHIYFSKDELVDTVVTDKDGYASSKLLPLGKYRVIETKTNENYVLDKTKYTIELNEIDNKTPIVYESLNIINKYNKGDLIFTKTDLTNGKVIPNAKFEIYTDKDELVYSGITDSEGQITIKDLFVGKFYIIETEAATGYRLSDEKVYFEIKENGEVIKANMTNEKKKGTLEFTKIDISTSEPLPNTKIQIFNELDELIFEGITNENGQIIITDLEYGRYYILESEAPEGYNINPERMYFEILEDGEIVKAVMSDEQVIIDVPITESYKDQNLYTAGLAFLILGTGATIYVRSNKRKK